MTDGAKWRRLSYRARTVSPPWALWAIWCGWCAVLVGLCGLVAASGQTPTARSLYVFLVRGPAIPVGLSAGLLGPAALAGGGDLRHTFASGGLSDWGDGCIVSLLAGLGGVLSASLAVRCCLPLPWRDVLGVTMAPTALFAAVGLCAGALTGAAWLGAAAVVAGWLAAVWFGPQWGVLDPFAAVGGGGFSPAHIAALGSIAASLAGLSTVDAAWPGGIATLPHTVRRAGAGRRLKALTTPVVLALGPPLLLLASYPALRALPAWSPHLPPANSARIAGTVVVEVAPTKAPWVLVEDVPLAVPALVTSVRVTVPDARVEQARFQGWTLRVVARSPSSVVVAGRALGWARSPGLLQLRLVSPAVTRQVVSPQIDGSRPRSVTVRWQPEAPIALTPVRACGGLDCWSSQDGGG